jgi:hypothetical protein
LKTPAMDYIADNGIRFTRAKNICPSRYCPLRWVLGTFATMSGMIWQKKQPNSSNLVMTGPILW